MTRLFLFLLLVCFSAASIKASPQGDPEDDDFQLVPWFSKQQLESPFIPDTGFVKTTLTGLQQYDLFNRYHPFFAHKGNVGHAGISMLFQPDLGNNFTLNPAPLFPGYVLKHDDIRFYRPKHVFTDLKYSAGSSREQILVANHNQKLHETLYLGAVYQIVNSPGFYRQAGARNSYIKAHLDFEEPGKRYQARGSAIFNRINNQESGGLSDHLAFEENADQESVILDQAVSRYSENAFALDHYYNMGFFKKTENDTINKGKFTNLGQISHNFSYRRLSMVFEDPVPPFDGYYDNEPVFEAGTYDSTRVHILENKIAWSNFPLQNDNISFPFHFKLFLKHQAVQVYLPDLLLMQQNPDDGYRFIKDNFNNLVSGAEIESDPYRLLSGIAKGSVSFGGYTDGDVNLEASLKLGARDQLHSFSIGGQYTEKNAPYFISHFNSNYVSWDNKFPKSKWARATTRYANRWLSVNANYYRIRNMVFMGHEALPVQNEKSVNVFSASLKTELGIGIFNTRHHVIFQTTNDDYFVNFPELAGRHSFFFDFFMFDRALGVQTGFDISFNLAYSPMAYMPVVRQFYAQDEYQGKDTHMIDFFANFEIARTRIFVKMENISGLVLDVPPVYLIPFYPVPQAAFKFGVSWMFFN